MMTPSSKPSKHDHNIHHNVNINLHPELHELMEDYLDNLNPCSEPDRSLASLFIVVAFFLLGCVSMWWACTIFTTTILPPSTINRLIVESPALANYKQLNQQQRQQIRSMQHQINTAYATEDELRSRAINLNNWLYQQDGEDGKEDGRIPGFHMNDIPDDAWPLPHSTPAPMPEPMPEPPAPCACADDADGNDGECNCNDDCGCGMNRPFTIPRYFRQVRPIQQPDRILAPAA